jgi:hypothetical protein
MKRSILAVFSLLLAMLSMRELVGKTLTGGVSLTVIKEQKRQTARQKLPSNPNYQEALKKFQGKNYADALKLFYVLDSSGFCCDLVHYYMGQCYQNTNQTVAAEQHYNWVLAYSKDPILVNYADYANQTLDYYSAHRTYAGQGNNFSRNFTGGSAGGGRSMGFG